MKKIIVLMLCVVLALSFVACGGSKIADGTYTAEVDEDTAAASYGWKESLTVTYKDGKIADVDFDAFNADGDRKSETTAETYPMDPHPSEWMPKIEANLKATTDAAKVATVAGATQSSDHAKALYAAVLEAAKSGKTDTVVVNVAG